MSFYVDFSFSEGKDPGGFKNEDVVVSSGSWLGVVDGATAKFPNPFTLDGVSGSSGWFASRVVANALESFSPDSTSEDLVEGVSEALNLAILEQYPGISLNERPSCSFVVTNGSTVVRVGDCSWGQVVCGESQEFLGFKVIDFLNAKLRSLVFETIGFDSSNDVGREFISPILKHQGVWANDSVSPFGYAVVNGLPVPERFVESWSVSPCASKVVLASDGYPKLVVGGELDFNSSESFLRQALDDDPLCVGVLASTKGLVSGNSSFDDRSWLELTRI